MDQEIRPPDPESAARGCLKFNNKTYPIFDGHNTIGRNPDANINIKDLCVSKHHGVITVVDDNLHYISDLKSSNGTVLNSKMLIPLKLYKLGDGASVKFGEVFCTYKKLGRGEVFRRPLEPSQNFTETFYASSTQEAHEPDLLEGINFNELPTQIFQAKEMNIHDMPTQVHNFSDANNSSSDSIDFMTMQKAESQMFAKTDDTDDDLLVSATSSVKNFVSDRASTTTQKAADSDTDDDLPVSGASEYLSTASQILPVGRNSRKITDSDTDDEPPPSQIRPVQTGTKKIIKSDDSDTEEYVVGKSKYHISDDSETDIEDNVDEKAATQNGGQTPMDSLRLTVSEPLEDQINAVAEVVAEALPSLLSKEKKIKQKIIPQDHIYCQALLDTQDSQATQNEEKESEEGKQTNQSTQQLDNKKKDSEKEEKAKKHLSIYSEGEITAKEQQLKNKDLPSVRVSTLTPEILDNRDELQEKNEDSDIFLQDTQRPHPEEEKAEEGQLKNEDLLDTLTLDILDKNDGIEEKNEDTDIFLQATQVEEVSFKEGNLDKNEEKGQSSSADKEEDIFLQATQVLKRDPKLQKDDHFGKLQNFLKSIDEEYEEIFLQPTQTLEYMNREDKPESSVKSNSQTPSFKVQGEEKDDKNKKSNEEKSREKSPKPKESSVKSNSQTPASEIRNEEKGDKLDNSRKSEKAAEESSKPKDNDNDLLLPPTQALEFLHKDDKVVPAQTNKITVMRISLSPKHEEDDLSPPSTQALESLLSDDKVEKNKKDAVIPPPSDFKTPSPVKKSLPKQHKSPEDDDMFNLPPTQALEAMHEDEAHLNQVEDQLHEIFASQSLMETQQLVDVLEMSRNEDIIDDSITEPSRKSYTRSLPNLNAKKAESLSVETVRTILLAGDDASKEELDGSSKELKLEDQPEDKARGKGLRTYSRKKEEATVAANEEMKEESKSTRSSRPGKNEDEEDQGETTRRSKRKQNLVVIDNQESTELPKASGIADIEIRNQNITVNSKTQGKRKQITLIFEESDIIPEVYKKVSQSSIDESEQNKTKGRQKGKTKTSKNDEINIEVDNEVAQSSNREDNKENKRGRGRKRENLVASDEEPAASVERDQSKSRGDTNKRELRKKESQSSIDENTKATKAKGKRKQNTDVDSEEVILDITDEAKSEDNKENKRGRGRRKQNLAASDDAELVDFVQDVPKRDEITEQNRRRGRSKQSAQPKLPDEETRNEENEEKTVRRGRRGKAPLVNLPSIDEHSSVSSETPSTSREVLTRANKRKNDESDKPDITPTKKKAEEINLKKVIKDSSPKRRHLKIASIDSEDDFVTETRNPVKKSPAKLRIPAKRSKEQRESDDEIITITPVTRSSRSAKKAKKEEATDYESITLSLTPNSLKTSTPASPVPSTSNLEESANRVRRLSANSKRQKKEEENKQVKGVTPLTATPERNRRILKPKVVFTMMDNPQLESLIRQLGGSVVDTVDCCTVLVTESVKRSQKLLCAVAQGKPICSPNWLHACRKAFSFVDPWDYILEDKSAEKRWKFSLRESLNRSAKTKLLNNYTFQLMVNNAADVLKGAIEACGGKCVTRNLPKAETDNLIIVSTENNKVKYSKIVKQNPRIKVVQAEAIFDGTLRQEFKFNDYLLQHH